MSNVTIYNTDFNTPFNALYNLVNNVGSAGIDSTNVLNLAGGNVNPGAFTGTFSFAGGLLSSTSAYWFLTTNSAAATTPSGGDLSIATSVSSGLLVLGSQASNISIDFGITTASQFTLPAGQAFSFPTPTAVTQGLGSAVPFFTSTGGLPAANYKVVTGSATVNNGFSGTAVTLSGNGAFTSSSSYIVVASVADAGNIAGYCTVTQQSGTQFTLFAWAGNSGQPQVANVDWVAVGN